MSVGCSQIQTTKKYSRIYIDTSTFIIISYIPEKRADASEKYVEMKHIPKTKLENSNLTLTENVFGPEKMAKIYLKLYLINKNFQAKKNIQREKELMKINIFEYLKLSAHINLFPTLLPEIYLRGNIPVKKWGNVMLFIFINHMQNTLMNRQTDLTRVLLEKSSFLVP